MLAVAANNLLGQSVMKIADIKLVPEGETLTIPAGTVVEFGSGAVLQIEGSLIVNGTASNPVIFRNINNNISGLGIVIAGSNYKSIVEINNVKFEGLIQPLRFDPFWHRKQVVLENIAFWNSTSGEPLIYVATSLTDLRDGRKIDFTIENSSFINNSAGILLENVGSDGIQYNINNLVFSDNNLSGNVNALGLMHFDFASLYKSSNVKVGSLSFTRNYAGNNPVGVSVAGKGTSTMNIDKIYQSNSAEDIIYDKHIDNRIPAVVVTEKLSINENGSTDIIKSISHNFGQVSLNVIGNPTITKLIDSAGNKVDYTTLRKGDTISLNYIQGMPFRGVLANGQQINIPKIISTDDKLLELSKIDTAQYNKYLKDKNTSGNIQQQSDVIGMNFKLPLFKSKDEIVTKLNTWEIGGWGGGATYGGGDIHFKTARDYKTSSNFLKNTIVVRDIPVFSTLEYSFGAYAQYNLNSRFSVKGSLYLSTISVHNLYAPGLFASGKHENSFDANYNSVSPSPWTYDNRFITRMQILEIEGLWHLRPYMLEHNYKQKLIPSLGLSLGIFHFTPYRTADAPRKSGESLGDYESRIYSSHMYNLRELGSEGQNFLPGAEQYSSIAVNIGSSFSLTYLRKRYSIKGEMKFVYTSTDYLDDFGPGLWYGGDINKLRASTDIQFSEPADLQKITQYNPSIAKNAPRSTNGLNDWYYQFHLGMSYMLFK
jgi:hypothetical protein